MPLLLFLLASVFGFFFSDGGGGGGSSDSGGDSGGDGDGGGDPGDTGGDGEDTTKLKDTLRKERDRAKKAERDLKALQAKVAEFENRDKSETEKLASERDAAAKRAEEHERRWRDAVGRTAVYEAAGKANAVSARAVYALIRDDLEFDDEGEPTNVDALIKTAKADEPAMFRAAAGSANGGSRDSDTKREFSNPIDRMSSAYSNKAGATR